MKKLRKAFAHQTPDVLKNVLSACAATKGEISMNNKKWENVTPQKRTSPWMAIAAAAAVLALVIGIGFYAFRKTPKEVPKEQSSESTEPTDEKLEQWNLESIVSEFQISPAKASLVLKAWEKDPTRPIEELVVEDVSVLMMEQIHIQLSDTIAYNEAKQIALDHAGVQESWNYEAQYTDGAYQISFCSGAYEYSYSVDGQNGEILSHHKTENKNAAAQKAAADAVLAFFKDFTDMTFLGQERDLSTYLAPHDSQVWAEAMDFLPFVTSRYYYDEEYLSNHTEYILRFAQHWCSLRRNHDVEDFEVSYNIQNIRIKGGYAQIYLTEEKLFRYPGETETSFLSDEYEIMLVNRMDRWWIFDMATMIDSPEKFPVVEEAPITEPTVPVTATQEEPRTVDPLQITEDWGIPKGNVRLYFSGIKQGMRLTNAEGHSRQFAISGAENDLPLFDERVFLGGYGPAPTWYTVPYSSAFTVDKNILAEEFRVSATWDFEEDDDGFYTVSAEGSQMEKIVLSVAGVEIFGKDMHYTLRCDDLENPNRYLEISGSGEHSVKLQRMSGGIFAIATRDATLRVIEEIDGNVTVLAEQILPAMTLCEVTQISQTPVFNMKEPRIA